MVKQNNLLVYILASGVFGILNTEMGFIGIMPFIAEQFGVSIVEAGTLVSLFALGVAISGPIMPLLFAGVNRKFVMLLVLGIFVVSNVVSIFTDNFETLLIARIIPAFFHPLYCSLAFSVAAAAVKPELAPKAVAKVVIGVSAGMVIGVPVSNFIAGAVSLKMALSFFAAVNIFVFLATLAFVPSMPVTHRLSYGSQLSVLKSPALLAASLTVVLMNGAVFGVFNYLAEYLSRVTAVSLTTTSMMLFVYGTMNILGSMLAGELLVRNAAQTARFFIVALFCVYGLLFFAGQFWLPVLVLTLLWGILGGVNANVTQHLITYAAPEAPDFANGLFLTSANLGTTLGTAISGLFIESLGIQYVVMEGMIFIVLAGAVMCMYTIYFSARSQLSSNT